MIAKLKSIKWRPGISTKVAGILLVPLLIQVVIFISLFALLDRTQNLAELEADESRLVEGLDILIIDRANGLGSFIQQIIENSKKNALTSTEFKERFDKDYQRILKLKRVNTGVMDTIEQIRASSGEEYEMLKRIENSPPEEDPITDKLVKMKMIRPAMKTFRNRIKQLLIALDKETQVVQELRSKEVRIRSQLRFQLSTSIFFDIVLALIMLVIFIRDLKNRLSKLTDNAHAVPAADNLPHQVSGTDELAYLDDVLHTAVRDLQAAKQHRAAVTAMVAHDLRTPLMSVRLIADGLTKTTEISESEQLRRKVKSLNSNIRRVFSLVEDLLTMERLEAGKMELKLDIADLRTIIEETFQTVEEVAQNKSIELINDVHDCEIIADRDRILQVLLNFLSNAIKFSPNESKIIVSGKIEGDHVKVGVKDQGKGISPEDQTKLFSKFFQTEEGKSQRGFGLGLAICKLLITEHGGNVGVESKIGEGSNFWFSLPHEEDV